MGIVVKNIEFKLKVENYLLKIKCFYYVYLFGYYVNFCMGYLKIEVNIM